MKPPVRLNVLFLLSFYPEFSGGPFVQELRQDGQDNQSEWNPDDRRELEQTEEKIHQIGYSCNRYGVGNLAGNVVHGMRGLP